MKNKNRHEVAWRYFLSNGEIPENYKPYEYSLHHIDTSLKYEDVDRYNEWRPEDLIVIKSTLHANIHNNGLADDKDYVKKLIDNKKPIDYQLYEKLSNHAPAWNKGIEFKHTDDWNKNLRQSVIDSYKNGRKGAANGKHWYNNGIEETYSIECPDGYTKGRLKGVLDNANNARLKRYAEHNRKLSSKGCEVEDKKPLR